MDSLEFMARVRGDRREVSPLEGARVAAWLDDQRQDAEDKRAAADKQAQLESRQEAWRFAESQFGFPTAELRRCQQALGEAEELIADLRARLARAEDKRDGYRSNVAFWAQRSQLVVDAVTRSALERLDPAEAAVQRAQLAAQDADRAGRAVLERARAEVQARRRRGGVSFRSAASAAPAHLADSVCCVYGTDDHMPHDQCFPEAPFADAGRSDAVLAEFANRGAAGTRKVSYR
jgi:hypothetical protein